MNSYGLEKVKSFDQLLPWLRDELHWPIDEIDIENESFDSLTFQYAGKELGLKKEEIAHIREIHQLRPFVSNQPWGIFFVNFDDKKIPIGVLKRLLGRLTLKKRQSANRSDLKGWKLNDLLFISTHGKSGERELSFLHFSEEPGGNKKIILKELGWDQADTSLKIAYVASTLKSRLVWPEDTNDTDTWRFSWASAFTSQHGAAIATAKDLTKKLGGLATRIRESVNEVISLESVDGPLARIYNNFKQALFHNLDHDGFADMYAQTICYGLLAASIMRRSGGLIADDAALIAPLTQPFLKDLMETFLAVGGRQNRIDFNELGIDEVVDTLRNADMDAVLLDFGNKNPNEDPILHFYEHFLKEYDSIMREQRGVYYTPLPVVKFIVRSVDEILQKEFGLKDGLADTITWGEMAQRYSKISIPQGVEELDPFVQILDPATGTGTFLVEVIDLIENRMKGKWKEEGKSARKIAKAWNEYVQKHLLTRLNGFELMMAPYAIAHIKIGMKLAETGYLPDDSSPRVQVYLTNTLEEATGLGDQRLMGFITDSLADEARGADQIKDNTPVTVVIGNPPYSRGSLNNDNFINELLNRYKDPVRSERNIQPLSDDYIKFLRYSEYLINKSGIGVHGMITNNTYLSGRTHRGMREAIQETFSAAKLVNLHGSAKVDFLGEQGKKDENVFPIMQGVAISLLTKGFANNNITYSDLIGPRNDKFKILNKKKISDCVKLAPIAPYFLWVPRNNLTENPYQNYIELQDFFKFHNVSGKPGDDSLLVSFSKEEVIPKIQLFWQSLKNANVKDLTEAQRNLSRLPQEESLHEKNIIPYSYRPFDTRYTYYHQDIWTRSVTKLKSCLNNKPILLTTKIVKDSFFAHVFVTREFPDVIFLSNTSSVNCYSFPMDIKNYENEEQLLSLPFEENIKTTLFAEVLNKKIENVELFNYIYAILHSPFYRSSYHEPLQYDFPRIPIPNTHKLFDDLSGLGKIFTDLHLLNFKDFPLLAQPDIRFIGKDEKRIHKGFPKHDNGKVLINPSCHFEDVTPEVWNFHIGGYQVCEKWLKDRAGKGGKKPHPGRVLSEEDILHYRRITVAIKETIALMAQVDEVINKHGGWPDAFYQPPPPPPSIEDILQVDESSEMEYKSTFQWDVKENKKNPDLKKACLKTITAFLNSKGGTLAIGVADDKTIYGLEKDLSATKDSLDWFEQTFRNACDDSIGVDFSQYIKVRFEEASDGKQVCIVETDPAPEPAFLKFTIKGSQPKQEFYIRRGNATKALEPKEQHDYIKKRFS